MMRFVVGSMAAVIGALVCLSFACSSDPAVVEPVADAGAEAAAPIDYLARGQYLVDHVAGCNDCHTPLGNDARRDPTRYLSGVECFYGTDLDKLDAGAGADGGDAGPPRAGCLNTRNLTNHETGLKNRTDQQIRDLITKGLRPDGTSLIPEMPYWVFANFSEEDLTSIVKYLRTVKPIEHAVPVSQAPWTSIPSPRKPVDLATVPMPRADHPDRESALRGRYLAAVAGGCVDCHTPHGADDEPDRTRWFAGSKAYDRVTLGLPTPFFPDTIYTANLTPDATGLRDFTREQFVTILKQGKDREGKTVCVPMPAGPRASFGGMTDQDANDLATYFQSIPPIVNPRPADCVSGL